MEQPARSPDCNPRKHIWDELGRAITSMDNSPHNRGEFRQALLDKWTEIPVEHLEYFVSNMPLRKATRLAVWGGNTQNWPGIHKTIATGSITQNQVCLTRFTPITTQWHLAMLMQSVSPISKNDYHKYSKMHIKQIVHTIHRKPIHPAKQPALWLHTQIKYG